MSLCSERPPPYPGQYCVLGTGTWTGRQAQLVGPALGASVTLDAKPVPRLLGLSGGVTVHVETPAPQGPAADSNLRSFNMVQSLPRGKEGSPCLSSCAKFPRKQNREQHRGGRAPPCCRAVSGPEIFSKSRG